MGNKKSLWECMECGYQVRALVTACLEKRTLAILPVPRRLVLECEKCDQEMDEVSRADGG